MASVSSVKAASVAGRVVPAAVVAVLAAAAVPAAPSSARSAIVRAVIVLRHPPSISSAVVTIAISPREIARKAIKLRPSGPTALVRMPTVPIRRVPKATARSAVRRAATAAVASAAAAAAAGVVGELPRDPRRSGHLSRLRQWLNFLLDEIQFGWEAHA